MINALEALERLKKGNQRFASGISAQSVPLNHEKRTQLAKGQQPFATILGCSDSRVPAEMIFDQGFGDLFVIRVAGNIVQSSQIGSVEFAASQFGTPLVVVLGHSSCGAILATLSEMQKPLVTQSSGLHAIVNFIRPSVEGLLNTELRNDPDALIKQAIKDNIRTSVNQLKIGSQIILESIRRGELLIVGAEYCLETGKVEFLEIEDSTRISDQDSANGS